MTAEHAIKVLSQFEPNSNILMEYMLAEDVTEILQTSFLPRITHEQVLEFIDETEYDDEPFIGTSQLINKFSDWEDSKIQD